MKDEERTWSHLTTRTNKMQKDGIAELKAKYTPGAEPTVDESDEVSAWFRAALRVADDVLASGDDDVGSAADFGEVELIDTLHQASVRANQYAQQSRQFLDGIFSSLAADLRAREGTSTLPPTDSDTPDTVTVLATATGTGSARADPIEHATCTIQCRCQEPIRRRVVEGSNDGRAAPGDCCHSPTVSSPPVRVRAGYTSRAIEFSMFFFYPSYFCSFFRLWIGLAAERDALLALNTTGARYA